MMYLLDTNIVSELRKPRPHGGIVSWVEQIVDTSLYLSVVTIGEIQAGIEIIRGQDTTKATSLEHWIEQVIKTYNILPMDGETFRIWAKLMHRQSDTVFEDAMIAATAIQHHLTVVTRNIKDFKRFDVSTLNPFQAETRVPS